METKNFDALIESICATGCIEVNRTIILLEKGEAPAYLKDLPPADYQSVLKELKSIMDIYGGKVCSL